MRARRALLYMPGDEMHKIRKATTLGVDCICMDMEDGVAVNRKAAARDTIVEALHTLDFGRSERLVRINPVGSGLEKEDLLAALEGHPDGVVVPKIETLDQILWTSQSISSVEKKNGWSLGGVCLIAIVESARAMINLAQIAGADSRLQALIFGSEDLVGDIGAVRTREGWEVFYARSAVVTHAAAFDLQAIDQVYLDFRDTEGLIRDCQFGVQLGFSGKQIIHPGQVVPVQTTFTPSDEAIAHALQLMEAFATHQESGRGAFALDGKMVDAPIIKAAERVLERARAAGKVM
jgi:citrate lyase beta subunit